MDKKGAKGDGGRVKVRSSNSYKGSEKREPRLSSSVWCSACERNIGEDERAERDVDVVCSGESGQMVRGWLREGTAPVDASPGTREEFRGRLLGGDSGVCRGRLADAESEGGRPAILLIVCLNVGSRAVEWRGGKWV